MHRVPIFLLLAGTCFAAQPAEDAVKKELKSFQGKWALIGGLDIDGKPASEEAKRDVTLTVDGNKFIIKNKGNQIEMEGTFTIDPTKKVKTIDAVVTKGRGAKLLGIYQIDGDVRKSCFAVDAKNGRPDGFRKEAGYITFEWKRAK